jgi:PmbA protein
MSVTSKVVDFEHEVAALLSLAQGLGLNEVEVYAQRDEALTLRAHKGELESFQRSNPVGVGVRVWQGAQVGYAYTENRSEDALRRVLEQAASNAALVEPQEGAGLFEAPAAGQATLMPSCVDFSGVDLQRKIDLVLELERASFAADNRVTAVPGCAYSDSTRCVRVTNSRGFDGGYRLSQANLLVYPLVAEAGQNKTYYSVSLARRFEALDPEQLARDAIFGAISRLGAKEPVSGTYQVVLTPRAMTELFAAFASIFSARAVQEGKSLLAGKLGQAIASPLVRIKDDASLETGFASRPFDDEGVVSQPLTLVQAGVLSSYLHNLQTARKAGVSSTGHGERGGYKGTLGVAPSNLFIDAGDCRVADLYRVAGPLVVVDDFQGLHAGTNIISGDFSLAAQGWLYEGGVRQYPVHNFTVAGNFLSLLADVDALGDDLAFYPHGAYVGSPSVRVRALAIAGA